MCFNNSVKAETFFITVVELYFQGAIQGPEEFVEGMALGAKVFVDKAVGKCENNSVK